MTAANPNPLPRPNHLEAEAGALRRILQEYVDTGNINQEFCRAALEITDVGRETLNKLLVYERLVSAYQKLTDELHHELYTTKDKLDAVMECFHVTFDEPLVRELADDFAAGRGDDAILRIVGSVEHSAKRKIAKLAQSC